MLENRIDRIDALIITHHHADHIMGLTDIRPYNFIQKGPIPTYASSITIEFLRKTFHFIFDIPEELKQYFPRLDLAPMNGEVTICGLRFHPFTVYHGKMPVTAFRFANTAYVTDVNFIPEENFELLSDLDLLILEAFRYEKHIAHYSLDEAVAVAERIGARRTLFTHLSHAFDQEEVDKFLPATMSLAYDGLHISLTD